MTTFTAAITYPRILADRQDDIALRDGASTGEFSECASDAFVDVLNEGSRQFNVLALQNDGNLLIRCAHLQ